MRLAGSTEEDGVTIVSLTFNPNGTISFVNQMTGAVVSTVPTNWYLPPTTGIGSSYRVRFNKVSGRSWDTGLANFTWYNLDTARTLTWSLTVDDGIDAVVGVEIAALSTQTMLGGGTLTVAIINNY
jgi:hypothetical protein